MEGWVTIWRVRVMWVTIWYLTMDTGNLPKIALFRVACLVTWPLIGIEAGIDFALIQT